MLRRPPITRIQSDCVPLLAAGATSASKPVLSISWTLRAPLTRWVRAGSVVRFTWTRAGGMAAGTEASRLVGIAGARNPVRQTAPTFVAHTLSLLIAAGLAYGTSRCKAR